MHLITALKLSDIHDQLSATKGLCNTLLIEINVNATRDNIDDIERLVSNCLHVYWCNRDDNNYVKADQLHRSIIAGLAQLRM